LVLLHGGGEPLFPFLRQKIFKPPGQMPRRAAIQLLNLCLNVLNRAHGAKLNDGFQLGKDEMIFDHGWNAD
jgi:hypothetical protein